MFKDQENNLHISNPELMELHLNSSINIIDVREQFEYNICHIPGSNLLPLQTLLRSPETLLKKDTRYYIICHTGQRSYYVTDYLTKKGFNVVNVLGGISQNIEYNIPY